MNLGNRNGQFGEVVPGFDIPVLNEREIRAAAGILFLLLLISFFIVASQNSFLLMKYFIVVFLADLLIRIYISPRFSPTLILGRLVVRNQNPEYVGAPQKRFAWKIGLALAAVMFVLIVVLNTFSIFTALSCFICMIFLFFETSFGICLGCLLYRWRYKKEVRYCPGEVCDVKSRQNIQKTSKGQLLVVLGMIVYVTLLVLLFNDNFSQTPEDLFKLLHTSS